MRSAPCWGLEAHTVTGMTWLGYIHGLKGRSMTPGFKEHQSSAPQTLHGLEWADRRCNCLQSNVASSLSLPLKLAWQKWRLSIVICTSISSAYKMAGKKLPIHANLHFYQTQRLITDPKLVQRRNRWWRPIRKQLTFFYSRLENKRSDLIGC